MTRAFYPLLFSGELGYELVHVEQKYPSLLGVSLVNDVFGRPGLTPPEGIDAFAPGGLRVHMGFADESFSVYDHPQVLVFENTGRRNVAQLLGILGPAARQDGPQFDPMLMPADEWDRQQAGGTLRDITPPDGIGARWPLAVWLLAVYAGTLVTLPLGLVVFRALPDRGYLLARPLGLLLLTYVPWLLASLGWIGFGRTSIALGFLLTALISGWLAYRSRESLLSFVRRRWRLLLAEEALFLIAFLAFVLVRAANPDLWHPYLGGEKPMDFAYLNAVLRSTTMPPMDPWFAGGALNYYYYGQFMVATIIRATGIPSAVAYNLAVPLFFALTAGAAFSLGYNITEGARRWLRRAIRPPRWSAIAAGAVAVAMTVVLGNLHGGGQLLRGAVSNFDFWAPTRMMPPDPPGFEITEFPFFTFLFADLHAHLMAMPLALLAVGLCLNTVLLSRRGIPPWRFALSFALLALTAGCHGNHEHVGLPHLRGPRRSQHCSGAVARDSTAEPGAGLSDCGAAAAVRHVGLGFLASVSPAAGERLPRPRRRPGDDAFGPVPRNTRTVHLRASNPAGSRGLAAHLALGVNARRPLAIGAGLCGRCSCVTRPCIDYFRPRCSGVDDRRSPGLVGPAAWVGLPPTLALGRHTRLGQRRSAHSICCPWDSWRWPSPSAWEWTSSS